MEDLSRTVMRRLREMEHLMEAREGVMVEMSDEIQGL